MASPAQLMETVSSATGVPLPTIVDIDRRLVKARLRAKAGRGFNAARMTPLDAARLLTAILASPQANASVDAVSRYAQTRVDQARSSDGLFSTSTLTDLASLRASHSFVDGLEAVIRSASTGSLRERLSEPSEPGTPTIEVYAFTRATYGRIRISGLPNGHTANVEYLPIPLPRTRHRQKVPAKPSALSVGPEGDLEQSRRITERTILAIGALLREEKPHDRR